MSDVFKVSGKRFPLKQEPGASWSFTARPGGWIIAESAGGERRRILASELRNHLSVSVSGKLLHGELVKERKHGHGAAASGGDSDLVAQFPGKVRKILVQPGQAVMEGDSLLLVEAMKMEFTIKAPANATVIRVLVQEGQQLSPGDRFLDLEMPEGEV